MNRMKVEGSKNERKGDRQQWKIKGEKRNCGKVGLKKRKWESEWRKKKRSKVRRGGEDM